MASVTPSAGLAVLGCIVSSACFAMAPPCTVDKSAVARVLGIGPLARHLSLEAATCDAITIDGDAVAMRLPAQALPVHGGTRAELALDFPFAEGDTVRYSWEMRVPASFRGDAPRNRWWSVAQWHDQPDPRTGETWATFPKRPPPLWISLEEHGGGLGIGLRTRDARPPAFAALPTDAWLAVSTTIRWSRSGAGIAALGVAGHPESAVVLHGANMANGYQHYLKLGQYRDPGIATTNSILFRHLRVARIGGNTALATGQ